MPVVYSGLNTTTLGHEEPQDQGSPSLQKSEEGTQRKRELEECFLNKVHSEEWLTTQWLSRLNSRI